MSVIRPPSHFVSLIFVPLEFDVNNISIVFVVARLIPCSGDLVV